MSEVKVWFKDILSNIYGPNNFASNVNPISRVSYWRYMSFIILFSALSGWLDTLALDGTFLGQQSEDVNLVSFVLFFLLVIPTVTVMLRRLKTIGRPWWVLFWAIGPSVVVFGVYLLALLVNSLFLLTDTKSNMPSSYAKDSLIFFGCKVFPLIMIGLISQSKVEWDDSTDIKVGEAGSDE